MINQLMMFQYTEAKRKLNKILILKNNQYLLDKILVSLTLIKNNPCKIHCN